MQLVIEPDGVIRCLYSEDLELHCFGKPIIHRASAVEPDDLGFWWANLAPVGGPEFGPFKQRSDAIAAEAEWLEQHWLTQPSHAFSTLHDTCHCIPVTSK